MYVFFCLRGHARPASVPVLSVAVHWRPCTLPREPPCAEYVAALCLLPKLGLMSASFASLARCCLLDESPSYFSLPAHAHRWPLQPERACRRSAARPSCSACCVRASWRKDCAVKSTLLPRNLLSCAEFVAALFLLRKLGRSSALGGSSQFGWLGVARGACARVAGGGCCML